jgi:CRP-like cAMP-binding protein
MASVSELLDISADLPESVIEPGGVLIEEGTEVGRLLILVSGDVIIERDGVPFAEIDQPGSVFGEMSVVLGQPASATVRAASEVTVRVADDPSEFLTQRPGAALSVLRMTAGRLDRMTQYLVDVKSQFAEMDGHLGMVDSILNTLLHHQGPAAQRGSARDPEGDHYH